MHRRFYTIGHSTRTVEELIALLREHEIGLLVDVRRFPGSRRHPHFNREALAGALNDAGITYRHEEDLGGRRSGRRDSPHTAWRVAAFRAYADHMETEPFGRALDRLLGAAQTTAVMCAEAVPWKCHRRLISDRLVAGGHEVVHVLGPGRTQSHQLHPDARILDDGGVLYAGAQPSLDF